MAVNLKPYYDAAQVADDEVQKIMDKMDAAFGDGTPEGQSKALELRPALDEAKTKAVEANKLYMSMRDASSVSLSMAKHFVPADPDVDTGAGPKEMARAEFQALEPAERMKFIQAGGKIV